MNINIIGGSFAIFMGVMLIWVGISAIRNEKTECEILSFRAPMAGSYTFKNGKVFRLEKGEVVEYYFTEKK